VLGSHSLADVLKRDGEAARRAERRVKRRVESRASSLTRPLDDRISEGLKLTCEV
jgi:hypothetical protein